MIAEPMTMATDYLLAALSFYFAYRLFRPSAAPAVRYWAATLAVMGLGAWVGGTSHGFAHYLGETASDMVWKATTYLIGISVYLMLAGTFHAFLSPAVRKALLIVILIQLIAYLAWMTFHDEFKYVIYDYVPAMIVVLALSLQAWLRRNHPGGRWLAWGIAVSFVAAAVQMSGFALHEHFNHNDLFHVIQMVATWMFYRGASLLS